MNPTLAKLALDNADPLWFWLLLIVASVLLLAATYRGIYRRSGRRLTLGLLALRLAGVLALFVALLKPSWTTSWQETQRPRVAVILDDSQSMSLQHAASPDGAASSRWQQAVNWLQNDPASKPLREHFDLTLLGVSGQELRPNKLPGEPTVEQTDLLRGLQATASRLRGQNVAGVILISDGRDTTGRPGFQTMEQYPLPVSAVGFEQPTGAGGEFDMALLSVDAPQRTLVHNQVVIKLLIGKTGGEKLDLPVRIERAGQPLHTQRIELPAGTAQLAVSITYTPTESGDFVLAARLPEQPGERSGANNVQLFKLRVDAEPIRVLYVEGVLRSEYTFLRDRLKNDPDIDLISFVRSASPEQASVAGVLVGSELINPERLKKIDVVLLGDFEARMLDEQAYRALRDWVEAGGGLMVLGGYRNLGQQGLGATALADLLPVELHGAAAAQLEEPFTFNLTSEGRLHPALAITGDLARDAEMWASLPKLQGVVVAGKAKPGATVLARHPRRLTGSEDDVVVLATQSFGQGSVALLAADTTWRWSRLARLAGRPDTLYARFWSQMVRWLGRRDLKDQKPALALSTDAPVYQRGERVTIQVRRNPAVLLPGDESAPLALEITVRDPEGRLTQVPARDTSSPDQWSAAFFPGRGGRFEVSARLRQATASDAQDVASQTAEFQVHGSHLELDDPSTNPALLMRIAQQTGGVYADISDPEALRNLVSSLPAQPRITARTSKASVWNHPALFLLFLALMTSEWVIRRRNQLV